MSLVLTPSAINQAFADAFNRRSIEQLLSLYEDEAVLHTDEAAPGLRGVAAIRPVLEQLLQLPGRMCSRNRFCIESGDLALLRADYTLTASDGTVLLAGSSAELARRQQDGGWRYLIDHAAGASLPPLS